MKAILIIKTNGVERNRTEIVAEGSEQITVLGQTLVDGNVIVLDNKLSFKFSEMYKFWNRLFFLFFPQSVFFSKIEWPIDTFTL